MISVEDVSMRYGERLVLDGVSLEAGPGEILAIMGSSGGGKTTLLRAIAGLITPQMGTITAFGIDVRKEPDLARSQMGMVFQQAALFDFLSVKENVLFGVKRLPRNGRGDMEASCASLLETVGLTGSEDLLPGQLSGGMKKRVGLARALALNPKAILYDEPVTGLDPVTAYTIDELIVNVRNKFGVTSLVVSHDVSSVFRLADRIAFLDGGKLSFIGSPEEFRKRPVPEIGELLDKSNAEHFF